METWRPASSATCGPQHTQIGVNVNCTGWKMKQFLFVASGANQGCTRTYVSSQPRAEATAGSAQRSSASLLFISLSPTQRGYKKNKGNEKENNWIVYNLSIAHFEDFISSGPHTTNTSSFFMKKGFWHYQYQQKLQIHQGKDSVYQTVKQKEWKKESGRWTTAHIIISLFFLPYLPGPSVIDLPHLHPWYFLTRPTWTHVTHVCSPGNYRLTCASIVCILFFLCDM